VKATEVTTGLAESNGSLLPGLWRDSLHVTCGLTACTPGSAPGPTLGNEYEKTLPLPYYSVRSKADMSPYNVCLLAFSQNSSGKITEFILFEFSYKCYFMVYIFRMFSKLETP